MKLPRGVQLVSYKTKDGTQYKYRVRINRKTFKADRLFDELSDATDFLSLSRSKDGRIALTEHSQKQQLYNEAVAFLLSSPNLSTYLNKYYFEYLKKDGNKVKHRSNDTYLSMISVICSTSLKIDDPSNKGLTAIYSKLSSSTEVRFGDLRIDQLNEKIATDYIRKRLLTVSKATVKREISLLQSFYNKLKFIDNKTFKLNPENPFFNSDKSLLKSSSEKRYRRLSSHEEDALIKQLELFPNKEMIQIFSLALLTGMRRGEILSLKWDDIKDNHIQVSDGKTGSRRVILSKDARSVIDSIEKKDDFLFHYTLDGFATNWHKIKLRAEITDFRFHDLRREFISRIIEKFSNPIYLSEVTTLKSPAYIQSDYVDPHNYNEAIKESRIDESSLLKTVGHTTIKTTSKYYTSK